MAAANLDGAIVGGVDDPSLRSACLGAFAVDDFSMSVAKVPSAAKTFIGFLPAARMSFMPGMRGRATSGATETTAGSGTSTVSTTFEGADNGHNAVASFNLGSAIDDGRPS